MSATDSLRQQISTHFGDEVGGNLAEECISLCQMYNLTADELFFKWEALASTLGSRVLNAETIDVLRSNIHRKTTKPETKSNLNMNIVTSKRLKGPPKLGGSIYSTPKKPLAGPINGANTGDSSRAGVAGPSKVQFVGYNMDGDSRSTRRYRYMYEKILDRSAALDDRIDDIAELVQKHYDIVELGDPSKATEEEITVVGRIAPDGDSSSMGSVKLNEASLTLESSRAMGAGIRIPLRFDSNVRVRGGRKGTHAIGLFPGAIVALRGRNGGGDWFLVTEILTLPPILPRPIAAADIGSAFSISIGCGPFTPDSDLKYEPWLAFLRRVGREKPAVILIVGPFIDSSHPYIKNGEIDLPPSTLFREIFVEPLLSVLDSLPETLALLVPNTRDILSDHAVFPQCELTTELVRDPRIIMLPNPCRFSLNGVAFAVSSVDILFHLRKEEFIKRASEIAPIGVEAQPDAMANLCRHVLQQRSFYPIFPVPLDAAHEVNLDITHSDGLSINLDTADDFAPDVLILPSKLKQFSKTVDHTVVVNPSFLTKGTFAHLTYAGSESGGTIKDGLRVDVVKLE